MEFTKPIEMPRATHYGNNYFVVYSNKIHRVCHFFSNLEYYNFLSLEINPEVEKFCEQPLEISIIQDGKPQKAIFDMWVRYKDGREELQEVKYQEELDGDDASSIRSQEQIRREEAWCKENGINFIIRTEQSIGQGRYFLPNANVIAARLRRYVPTALEYDSRVIRTLRKNGTLTVETLIENQLLPIDNELNHLCYMYEKGFIKMNISDYPFSFKTEVSL